MLHSIPIDIVEMIIVKSFDYGTFIELKKFLTKLNETSRIARINDKLTISYLDSDCINYKLNNYYHREYDKPSSISDIVISWHMHGSPNRINNPSECYRLGRREWCMDGKYYRTNDYPHIINHSGTQEWYDDDRKPNCVYYNGFRDDANHAFYYL